MTRFQFRGGGDEVWLKNSSGQTFATSVDTAAKLLEAGDATAATGDDVAGVLRSREQQDAGRTAVAFGESAAAGAADAVIGGGKRAAQVGLAAGRAVRDTTGLDVSGVGGMDALAGAVSGGRDDASAAVGRLSGRRALADLATITGTAGEYMSGSPVAGQSAETGVGSGAAYDRASRQRAIDNPEAAMAGRIVGEAGVGIAMGGGAGGIAGLAAQGAVEGALSGMAQADEDAWVKDKETTAEALLWGAGLGGVLGGGAGAGFGLLGRAGKRAASSMYDAAADATSGRLASEAGGVLDDGTPRFRLDTDGVEDAVRQQPTRGAVAPAEVDEGVAMRVLDDIAPDLDEETRAITAQAMSSRAAPARRIAANGPGDFVEDQATRYARAAGDMDESAAAVVAKGSEYLDTVKVGHMAARVDEGKIAIQAERARGEVAKALGALEAAKASLIADGSNNALYAVRRILDDSVTDGAKRTGTGGLGGLKTYGVEAFEKRVSKAASEGNGGEIALALDDFKRSLGKTIGKARERAIVAPAGRAEFETVRELVEGSYTGVQRSLEDSAVWGSPWASMQRDFNETLSEMMLHSPQAKRLTSQFSEVQNGWGTKTRKVTQQKVASFMRGLGAEELGPEQEAIRKYLGAQKKLARQMRDYDVIDDAAYSQVGQLSDIFDETVVQLRAGKALRQAWGDDSVAKMAIRGVPFVGEFAAEALTPSKMLARLESMAEKLGGKDAREAVGAAMGEVTDAVGKTTGKPSSGPAPAFARAGENAQQAFRRQLGALRKLAEPDVVASRLALGLSDIADVAPQTASHVAARTTSVIGYLLERAPGVDREDPFRPGRSERVATARDITVWGRQYQVATDPASVLDMLQSGHLRREHVQTLRDLYPGMYGRVQDSARDALAKKKGAIPYARRRQMDLLLELDGIGEPTAAPDFQRQMAAAASAVKQAEQRKPPSRRASPDVARLTSGLMSGIQE